jgi:hypothetical protein
MNQLSHLYVDDFMEKMTQFLRNKIHDWSNPREMWLCAITIATLVIKALTDS